MKTNAEHLADLIADPGDKRHGTRRGVELGCRCASCLAKRDELLAARREADRAKRMKRKKPAPASKLRKRSKPSKNVCTVDSLLLPMMGKPSIDNLAHVCCVCGKPATNSHHIVRRGAGKLIKGGREVPKPTVRLCGSGNASGCHGLAHANRLHFRWVATACADRASGYVTAGGHWEYLLLDEPTKYQGALAVDGWRPL